MSTPDKVTLDAPLAIVGEEDVIEGFRALGFVTHPVKDAAGCAAILARIAKEKTAVCLVQEDFYSAPRGAPASGPEPYPVFIPFSKSGRTDALDGLVKNIRLRATGAF